MQIFNFPQEAWKQLSSQMNEMVKTNKLLKNSSQEKHDKNDCTLHKNKSNAKETK